MTYTQQDFGRDLRGRLAETDDPVLLARWAYSQYLIHVQELEPRLKRLIMTIVAMEEGPEFEMSVDELRAFAEKLEERES